MEEATVLVHGSTPLRVVGLDYPMEKGGSHALPIAQRDVYMKASAKKVFAEVPKGEMAVCLSHHPDFFPFAVERGARLTLAGHTYGGQVALFGKPLLSLLPICWDGISGNPIFMFQADLAVAAFSPGCSQVGCGDYVTCGRKHLKPIFFIPAMTKTIDHSDL